MKRWGAPVFVVLLCCLWIVLSSPRDPRILQDTDTRVLLEKLEERNAPLSWFRTDWPLENHFYRPVSTLSFELDRWLHPGDAAAFGLFSGLLCAGCVLALFWFLRELTNDAVLTTSASVLFAVWNVRISLPFLEWLFYAAWLVLFAGVLRHGFAVRKWLPAALAIAYLPMALAGAHMGQSTVSFPQGVLNWLPSRTATVMTLFCLLALACYTRYERLTAAKAEKAPSPLDPPATRTTQAPSAKSATGAWVWPLMAVYCVALALGSYEQAVMLPAVLTCAAFAMRLQGFKVRWAWQGAFWALLVIYILVRREVIPTGTSGYQLQQFRDGPGVALSIVGYALPALTGLVSWLQYFQVGSLILLTLGPYVFPIEMAGNLVAYWAARKRLALAFAGWAMSLLAFLPMAWLKPFVHYHYWPMALRSLLVVALVWAVWDLIVTAVSPPGLRAPARPSPAPGSLPRL